MNSLATPTTASDTVPPATGKTPGGTDPTKIRNTSLVILATLAAVFALHWAAAVLIPLVLALLFSYGLTPVVDWLQQRHIPRALSAALLILGLLGGIGAAAYAYTDDAVKLIESLPLAAQKLRETTRALQGPKDSTLTTVQKAAAQLEQVAEETGSAAGTTPVAKGVQRVQVEKPKFAIKDYLWTGTLGLIAVLSQMLVVALLSFFMLVSGDSFRRKLVRLAGPTLSSKRITLEMLDEISSQVRLYMRVQLFTSLLVGLATWLCFWALGLQNAAVWGIAAGVLDLVPYIGGTIIAGGSALVAFMQFGTLQMALLMAVVSVIIHSIEAFFLTPFLTSRAGKLNPVAIFTGVLVWGWLWGPFGLLLGMPILMVVKAVSDRVDSLNSVGELLSD